MTTPKSLTRLALLGPLAGAALLFACVASFLLASAGVAAAAEEEERDVLLGTLPGVTVPRGVAFDQTNGTVIVANGQGEPGELRFFPAAGGPAVLSLPGAETPQGHFQFDGVGAVAPGIAVDAGGDVFVSATEPGVVDKFEPVGNPATSHEFKYVCQFSGPGRGCMPNPELELGSPSTFGEVVGGLAFDTAGDLFVADPENDRVDEFDPSGGDVAQFEAAKFPLITSAPVSVAVGNHNELFVGDAGRQVVELERNGAGAVVGEQLVPTAEPDGLGITFDRDSGLLLLAESGRVSSYDPATNVLTELFETPNPENMRSSPLATQETLGPPTGDIYVEDREENSLEIFGTPPPLRPAVSAEAVSSVTVSSAQVSATVEPKFRGTHYQFQFGPTQAYGSGALPVAPGGFIPGTQASALAGASLTGLVAGATYHYRIVATNREGTAFGPDETFTTFAPLEAGLPDGRVYEMVSPLDKNGGVVKLVGATQASANGEKIAYVANAAFAGAQGNNLDNQYLSTRSAVGWETEGLAPPQESRSYLGAVPFHAFSPDLSRSLMRNGGKNAGLPILNEPIAGTGAPAGYSNFYVRNDETDSFQALLTSPPVIPDNEFYMAIEAVTPSLSHIVETAYEFSTQVPHIGLNEWTAGQFTPINVGEHGELVTGAVLGSGLPEGNDTSHALSDDGSRAFWSVGGDVVNTNRARNKGSEPVFVREGIGGGAPRTVRLPPGEFLDASAQTGARVLLSTGEVFDVEHDVRVADLTDGLGGFVNELGASEDLSRIYFIDSAVLPAAHANPFGAEPQAGANNVYLYREGAPSQYVATLMPGGTVTNPESPDRGDWGGGGDSLSRPVRVTADGEAIVFQSQSSLTGYDNISPHACPAEPGTSVGGCSEVFVFHAGTGKLVCVSCNPTGERPSIGGAEVSDGNSVDDEINAPRTYYLPRNLSADGHRVFFTTDEALVPQDTNGAADVYEWEEDGEGSCRKTGGCVFLISSGTGTGAEFIDASESGGDVFLATANQLVPGDTDDLKDVYDARVGGGFPAPATATACTGTGCQGVPAPAPLFATPSSETFNGVGNFPATPAVKPPTKKTVKCAKGFTKKKNRCVKTKKKKAKRASHNRRASK